MKIQRIDMLKMLMMMMMMMTMMVMMMMIMIYCFCGMVYRRKTFSLMILRISDIQNHCQRFSLSRISDMLRAGFHPAQNLSSGLAE